MTTIPTGLAALGLVVPAVTGLAGYLLAGRNARPRDERAAAREAISRRASVTERLEEQRHASYRETLLELQDALQRLVRCTAQVIFHDESTLKQQGTLTLLGEELDAETYEVGVTARRLQERILDSTPRETVGEFRSHVAEIDASVAFVKEMTPDDGIRHLQKPPARPHEPFHDRPRASRRGAGSELEWLPGDP